MARQLLRQLWTSFSLVEVSQPLVQTAGRFADGFALRGEDSVQLAATSVLQASTDEPIVFACFDRRLNLAAQLLRLRTLA